MANSCWESALFAGGREFGPGWRHKKRPHTEASSMLDKSFCAKPDKWLWTTTTIFVVTQTHLSRIAKSLYPYYVVFRIIREQENADDRTGY